MMNYKPNDEVVFVAALNGAGFIKTGTSCNRDDAAYYSRYYHSIGYNTKVMTYDELHKAQQNEYERRRTNVQMCF